MKWWPFFRKRALPEHLRTGEWGEDIAAAHLKKQGYRILGRRIRPAPRAELDIVAQKDGLLLFVEVRTRASEDFGRAASTLRREKRRNVSRAARKYLMKLRKKPDFTRIDVIEVVGSPEDRAPPVVRQLEHAFKIQEPHGLQW
jgi:putative endonuclease